MWKNALKDLLVSLFWGLLLLTVLSIVASILVGCDLVGDAVDQCKEAAQEAAERATTECREEFETNVIPAIERKSAELQAQLEMVIEDLQDWFEMKIDEAKAEAEVEILTRFGCKQQLPTITNPTGWDCSSTWVCQ